MSFKQQLQIGTKHVSIEDPVLSKIIKEVGPCTISANKDYFGALVSSIVSQQISVKAADTIYGRFLELIGHQLIPEKVNHFEIDELRKAGLSKQKASYILDLSSKFIHNPGIYNHLENLEDELAIKHLTQVKGIGEWTAQMFLMFSLERLDILPHLDVGFKNAVLNYYQLSQKPSKKTMEKISEPWKPYRSIGVWYLWAITDQG